MKKKLMIAFFTISTISTAAYSDQPPIVIDAQLIQEINNFNNYTGLVSAEVTGVGGGEETGGGGSCGGFADCDGGVSIANPSATSNPSLEIGLTVEDISLLLRPDSAEAPGVGPVTPTSPGPSCDCDPSIGTVLSPSYLNIENANLVDLAARKLGLIQSR